MMKVMYCMMVFNVDWFVDYNSELRFLIDFYYLFLSLFIIVVILNLLLAILFDTYDKVLCNILGYKLGEYCKYI